MLQPDHKVDKAMSYDVATNFLKQSDRVLGQLIEQVGPCLLHASQQNGDLFASLSRAILHQQLSTKAAATIHSRFLQLYPGPHGVITRLESLLDKAYSTQTSLVKWQLIGSNSHQLVD